MPIFSEREDQALRIPYPALANSLFGEKQELVPFLGAGASLQPHPALAAPAASPPDPPTFQMMVDQACSALGIPRDSLAREFLEIAFMVAWKLQNLPVRPPTREEVYASVKNGPSAPSASQLADAFAHLVEYDYFEPPAMRLKSSLRQEVNHKLNQMCLTTAAATEVAPISPPLLSITSYFQYIMENSDQERARDATRQELEKIFQNVTSMTVTHRLIARSAKMYLDKAIKNQELDPFLIITTNYDDLMENALDLYGAPYIRLTVGKNDRKVYAEISPKMKDYFEYSDRRFVAIKERLEPKLVDSFALPPLPKPIVILYKVHGALDPGQDSIVLSEEDYVTFLHKSGQGMVPSPVVNNLDKKSTLFLGYSFSDWNIRALYRRLKESVTFRGQDWAVILKYDRIENMYFTYKKINVLETDLATFCTKVWQAAIAAGVATSVNPNEPL